MNYLKSKVKIGTFALLVNWIVTQPSLYAMMDELPTYEELSRCHICYKQSSTIKENEQHLNTIHAKKVREDAERMKGYIRVVTAGAASGLVGYGLSALVTGGAGAGLGAGIGAGVFKFVDDGIKELDSKLTIKVPAPKHTSAKNHQNKKPSAKKISNKKPSVKKSVVKNSSKPKPAHKPTKEQNWAMKAGKGPLNAKAARFEYTKKHPSERTFQEILRDGPIGRRF